MATANDIIATAESYLGNEGGATFKEWYADLTGNPEMTESWVSWCAIFVSYVFARCGQDVAGLPGSSCGEVMNDAMGAGLVVDSRGAAPGDIVIFDWGRGDGGHDHIGIVTANNGDSGISTIEGNTSNAVNRRDREWGQVQVVIRPQYDGRETGVKDGHRHPAQDPLLLDGYFGKLTAQYMQATACSEFVKMIQQHLLDVGCYYDEDGDDCFVDGDWGTYTTIGIQRAIDAGVL